MNKIKVTVVALATLGAGLAAANAALAGPSHLAPKAPAASPTTDGDQVQQGDQTTPDAGTAGPPEAASATVTRQSPAPAAESATPEASGSESTGSQESGLSDGNDGGHADASVGDVNHVGGADEK